jgi:hypothetical protein
MRLMKKGNPMKFDMENLPIRTLQNLKVQNSLGSPLKEVCSKLVIYIWER